MYDIISVNPFETGRFEPTKLETYGYKSSNLLLDYRDVKVYISIAFDYVFDGVTITQRAGFNKEGAMQIIDQFHDGNSENKAMYYHNHIALKERHNRGVELRNKFK